MHRDPDLISASRAAEACGLGYSEEFNRLRWGLEELVDPASQETVPMPASLAVPYLTGAQIAKLPAHEREGYLANRTERIAWTKTQWMRVPCWGGVRPPGGEWRYSLAACRTWRGRMQHAGAAV